MATVVESDTQRVIRGFNFELIAVTCLTFAYGVITLYSATKGPGISGLYKSQLIWFGVGSVVTVGLIFVDSDFLKNISYFLYAVVIGLLVLVLFIGKVGGGSQRWINLGFFHLQPSELAKLAIVFVYARYFSLSQHQGLLSLKNLVVPFLILLPSFLLVVMQPDIGTAGIVFLAGGSLVLFVGVRLRSLLILVFLALLIIPLSYRYLLRDYQRKRVITFLDPMSDPRGSGYNALQCKIAVGSGQWFGKGYLKGTQAQLNFIPEQHTDFIFSVLAEERGFAGALVLLVLYFLYCLFGLRTVLRARDKFEMLLAFGMVSIMFWHVFINLGMVVGILPVVGVTLPLFSYGGSSLITFLVATGILLNLSRKRYIF